MIKDTVKEIREKIEKKQVTIVQVVNNIYEHIEKVEPKIDAYLSFTKEYALTRAKLLQSRLDEGKDIGILGGVPIAIKDNICMKDTKTTCASRMLENFVSPYNATIVERLEEAGAIIIGKTNMDEFAMGSSTESSYFKKTNNPWDTSKVPGGSSGGSSAAVASDMAYASLGSDTGGSIRQPASYCGVVGMKPTYGLVSRYGLVAFASSLDQIGPFTKDVTDMAMLLNAIVGWDERDSTSLKIEKKDYTTYLKKDVQNMTIGVPSNFIREGLQREVKDSFYHAIELLKSLGATIQEINLDYAKYSLATYYILATAEASSNLGRFDGIRYGHRADSFDNIEQLYKKSRSEGFGDEVKRRIMLGTYVLSSGYYDAFYKKATKVRTLITEEFKKAFEQVDVIATPTAPKTAFSFGEKSSNPVEMYLEDIYTVPVNIAGLPGISVPCGLDDSGMPIGLQFIGDMLKEEKLLQVAYTFEQQTTFHNNRAKLGGV